MDIKQVINTRLFKNRGYILVKELIDGGSYGGRDIEMHSAYSWPDLYYIGDSKQASRFSKLGIDEFYPADDYKPIKELLIYQKSKEIIIRWLFSSIKTFSCVISDGQKEIKKWYGWSHRAIYCFAPGSEVKRVIVPMFQIHTKMLLRIDLIFGGLIGKVIGSGLLIIQKKTMLLMLL